MLFDFIANIFTKEKTVTDIFDKDNGILVQAGEFIGNLNLTDEEVMESNAKTVSNVNTLVVNTLDESTERSKNRRDIANKYMNFYLDWASVGFGAYFFVPEYSRWLLSILTGLAFGGAFTAIIIFHFGSHGLVRHNNSKK